jgi:hypothetical protein
MTEYRIVVVGAGGVGKYLPSMFTCLFLLMGIVFWDNILLHQFLIFLPSHLHSPIDRQECSYRAFHSRKLRREGN